MLMRAKIFTLLCGAMVLLTSCNGNKPQPEEPGGGNILDPNQPVIVPPAPPKGGSGFLMVVFKEGEHTYMQQLVDLELSQKLSKNAAVELPKDAAISNFENEIYVMSSAQDSKPKLYKYLRNPHGFILLAMVAIPQGAGASNFVCVSATKAYMVYSKLGKIVEVNPQTLVLGKEIDLKSYAHGDTNPDLGYAIKRGKHIFIPLLQHDAAGKPYADYKQVDILQFNTETNSVEKVISEKTTGMVMPSKPALSSTVLMNDSKDLYFVCQGSETDQTFKSGILCIPNGKDEVDLARSWVFTGTPIEGTDYKVANVYGIARKRTTEEYVAYVGVQDLYKNEDSFFCMAVALDLENRKVTKIKGIPLSSKKWPFVSLHFSGSFIFSVSGEDNLQAIYGYHPSVGKGGRLVNAPGEISLIYPFE